MSTSDSDIGDVVRQSWRRFLEIYEPLRPDLYRYCRHLTRSPWDAEDLAQDAMARGFVTLGCIAEPPPNPRAWLFRVERRAAREAAGTLIAQLSPQERAAVVLKDVFDFSLDEIAEALSTTAGAIKAALHRGRTKLIEPEPDEPAPIVPAVLDAFCEAFNARDLDRLTALLLDATTMEYPGLKIEDGAKAVRAGTLQGTLFGCPDGDHELLVPPRCEVRVHRGKSIFLWWSGDEVHAVVRVEVAGDRIALLRNYYHAPEVMMEICRELALPFRTHGYRFWA